MRKKLKIIACIFFIGIIGCAAVKDVNLVPQSHFDFPNSNIIPIGTVSGMATSSSVFFPDFSDDVLLAAYNDALSKKGGDLLINIKVSREVSMIPLLFVPIYTTVIKIEGTAAKMEVGKQELSKIKKEQIYKFLSSIKK